MAYELREFDPAGQGCGALIARLGSPCETTDFVVSRRVGAARIGLRPLVEAGEIVKGDALREVTWQEGPERLTVWFAKNGTRYLHHLHWSPPKKRRLH